MVQIRRYRSSARFASIAMTCLVFCGCCKKGESEGQPAVQPLPAAVRALAPHAPYVRVEGSMILVDEGAAGSTRPIEDMGRMMMIDGLRDALTAKREAQRASNPSAPFAGQVILECDAASPALVFKSVFLTIAHAGYPHILVRTSEDSVVSAEARLPSVRIFGEDPPARELHVQVRDEKVAVVSKQGATTTSEQEVPVDQRDPLVAKLVERLKAAPLVGATREVSVHADNRIRFSTLATTIDAADAARGRIPKRSGGRPAFDIVIEPG